MLKLLTTLLLFITLTPTYSNAQMSDDAFVELMDELESVESMSAKELSVAWWLPLECWKSALEKEDFMTPEEIEYFLRVLKPYTIVAVVNGTSDENGGFVLTPEVELRKKIKLFDTEENVYRPIPNSEVNPELIVRLSMIKPLLNLSNEKWGENYSLFIFNNKAGADRCFDPFGSGEIVMTIKRKEYNWQTPLEKLENDLSSTVTEESTPTQAE